MLRVQKSAGVIVMLFCPFNQRALFGICGAKEPGKSSGSWWRARNSPLELAPPEVGSSEARHRGPGRGSDGQGGHRRHELADSVVLAPTLVALRQVLVQSRTCRDGALIHHGRNALQRHVFAATPPLLFYRYPDRGRERIPCGGGSLEQRMLTSHKQPSPDPAKSSGAGPDAVRHRAEQDPSPLIPQPH